MISGLLKNEMIEMTDEARKKANYNEEEKKAANAEDEDEKQQEEEKKEVKKEEKRLYDLDYVYRTKEKRLKKNPQKYVANTFGFKDKIGEGVNTELHFFYDPSLDSGTVTVRNGKSVYKII